MEAERCKRERQRSSSRSGFSASSTSYFVSALKLRFPFGLKFELKLEFQLEAAVSATSFGRWLPKLLVGRNTMVFEQRTD